MDVDVAQKDGHLGADEPHSHTHLEKCHGDLWMVGGTTNAVLDTAEGAGACLLQANGNCLPCPLIPTKSAGIRPTPGASRRRCRPIV